MSIFKRFTRSGLMPIVFMTIAVASASLVVYKTWLGPYVRKQRYREAEAWANMMIEQEERESNTRTS